MMLNRRARGFSMIELMFVIAILGVLLAVGLPRLSGSNERAALRTTARDLASMAAYARQAAISKQGDTRIIFDTEEREWRLLLPGTEPDPRRRRDPISVVEETNKLHPKVNIAEFRINDEVIEEEQIEVVFRANGSCSGLVMLLENSKGRRLTVEIDPGTGRPSVYVGPPKSLAQKLFDAGADPGSFKGVDVSELTEDADSDREDKQRFYRVGESSDERVSRYSDTAARIMGRVRNQHNRYEQARNERDQARGLPNEPFGDAGGRQ